MSETDCRPRIISFLAFLGARNFKDISEKVEGEGPSKGAYGYVGFRDLGFGVQERLRLGVAIWGKKGSVGAAQKE